MGYRVEVEASEKSGSRMIMLHTGDQLQFRFMGKNKKKPKETVMIRVVRID